MVHRILRDRLDRRKTSLGVPLRATEGSENTLGDRGGALIGRVDGLSHENATHEVGTRGGTGKVRVPLVAEDGEKVTGVNVGNINLLNRVLHLCGNGRRVPRAELVTARDNKTALVSVRSVPVGTENTGGGVPAGAGNNPPSDGRVHVEADRHFLS